jgi:hypothetical protein
MTTLREAAQQALEALGSSLYPQPRQVAAIAALRAALAEPVQEPVAWLHTDAYNPRVRFLEWAREAKGYRGDWIKTPLYTAPPQRKPLTEEEIDNEANNILTDDPVQWWRRLARAVEAAHGIGSKT